MLPGGPPLDPVLARDYPRPLREAYTNALRRSSAAERHHQLLRLGEIALSYLASLAFADYRRSTGVRPSEQVEEFLRSTKRFTMGQYLALFRMTQRALGQQEIFGLKRHEVNVRLEEAQRWVSAVRAIEYAQKVGARDIPRVVEEGLKQPTKGVRWLAFWEELVTYRNQVAHADANQWPVDAPGYFEAVTRVLESALVEALRTEHIGYVLLEYPTAQLVEVRRLRNGWVQRFDGEYHGVPLLETVTREVPPEPWESEVGCTYVLQGHEHGWRPHSRFYDLAEAVPEPREPDPSAKPRSVDDRSRPPGRHIELARPPAAPPDDEPAADAPPRPARSTGASDRRMATLAAASAAPDDLRPAASTHGTGGAPAAQERPELTPLISSPADLAASAGSEPWFPSFSRWMLWGILSLGFLAGIGFLRVATQIRDTNLRNAGVAYCFCATVVLVLAAVIGDSDDYPVLDAVAVGLLFGTWIVSTLHAFAVNPRVQRRARRGGRTD